MVPTAFRVAVLLLVLGASAASAATSITGGPGLSDILMKRFHVAGTSSSSNKDSTKSSSKNATTAGSSTVSVASITASRVQEESYGEQEEENQHHTEQGEESHHHHEEGAYSHMQEKEVCLQETKKKTCSGGGTAATPAVVWTSEFGCCQETEYGYGSQSGLSDRFRTSATNTIGSCEWAYTPATAAVVSTNIKRVGLASAVCYFGPESHECGGPLCERLMMSLEGPIYSVASVYSYYGASNTNDAGCAALTMPWGDRMAAGGGGGRTAVGGPARRDLGSGVLPINRLTTAGAPKQHYPQAEDQQTVGLQYNSDRQQADKTVYLGSAYIITGMVTSFAGQRKEKWDEGTFEYTVDYDTTRQVTGGLDANIPWVRDKTYKITFLKHVDSAN